MHNKNSDLLIDSVVHVVATIWFVYAFESVSGDYFNAGITFAFAVDGKMKTTEVIGYLAAQGIRVLLADALKRWR
jgi:glycerol uptake facilitator-like aquaporin